MSRKRLVGIIFVVVGCVLLVRCRGILSAIADIILIAVGIKLIISGKIVKSNLRLTLPYKSFPNYRTQVRY